MNGLNRWSLPTISNSKRKNNNIAIVSILKFKCTNGLIIIAADGLSESSRQFYQVTQATTVILGDQSPAPQSQSESDQEEPQAIAGVDDLLNTLNQLIIEPITKKNSYQKYGEYTTMQIYMLLIK